METANAKDRIEKLVELGLHRDVASALRLVLEARLEGDVVAHNADVQLENQIEQLRREHGLKAAATIEQARQDMAKLKAKRRAEIEAGVIADGTNYLFEQIRAGDTEKYARGRAALEALGIAEGKDTYDDALDACADALRAIVGGSAR